MSRPDPFAKMKGLGALLCVGLTLGGIVGLPSFGKASGSSWGRVSTQSFDASRLISSTLVGDFEGKVTILTGREVRRFLADGSQDLAFSTNAAATIGGASASHIAVQPSGRILVVGTRIDSGGQLRVELTRLNFDGLLDTSFGVAGRASAVISAGPTALPSQVFVDPLGRITTVVSPGGSGSNVALIQRWRAWGALDVNFGAQGLLTVPLQTVDGIAGQGSLITSWEDGSFLVDNGASWTKFMTNGSVDTAFGNAGSLTPTLPVTTGETLAWVPSMLKATALSDGRLIVVALATDSDAPTIGTHFVVTRLLASGALDLSFGDRGLVIPIVSPGDGQTDRALLLGGVHRSGSWITISGGAVSINQSVLIRMSSDGIPDPSFGINGVLRASSGGGCDDHVATLTLVNCIAPVAFLMQEQSPRIIQRFQGEAPVIAIEQGAVSNGTRTVAPQVPEPEVYIGRRAPGQAASATAVPTTIAG